MFYVRVKSKTVFPACAGMNRRAIQRSLEGVGVPRMRGDEPAHSLYAIAHDMCSPHARG